MVAGRRRPRRSSPPAAQRGVGFLVVLFIMAVMGTLLASAGEVWQTIARRERERQLLFVGQEFRNAIRAYREHTPGAVKEYPKSLSDLVEDKRLPTIARYLRRIYRDPLTDRSDWGLVLDHERIVGVYSRSTERPLKHDGFLPRDRAFAAAETYADWRFVDGE